MSSEALERALSTVQGLVDGPSEWRAEYQGDMRVIRAEVARLEQERDEWKQAAECVPTSWADIYGREHELREAAEAALAVAREREQRRTEKLAEIETALILEAEGCTHSPWLEVALDAARAALVDEPAAAETLHIGYTTQSSGEQRGDVDPAYAEPAAAIGRRAVDAYRHDLASLAGAQTVASVGQPPAAAMEPSFVCPFGHRHYEGMAFCTVCGTGPVLPAAATLAEPGDTERNCAASASPGSASAAADEGAPEETWFNKTSAAADEPGETPA